MPVKKKRRNRRRGAWCRQAQAWLAEKLRMRSAANVRQQRRRLDKKRVVGRVPEALKRFLEEVDGDAHE